MFRSVRTDIGRKKKAYNEYKEAAFHGTTILKRPFVLADYRIVH